MTYSRMHLIKEKEKEPIDWRDHAIAFTTPPSWYIPGLYNVPEAYNGPPMDFRNYHNSNEARTAWQQMERANAWCNGTDCEFGHDRKGNPYIRMKIMSGCSMWYPLHEAAKRWGRARQVAQTRYLALVQTAEENDQDGPAGAQPRDEEGFLREPMEDDVPHLEDTDGDEDDDEGDEEGEDEVV